MARVPRNHLALVARQRNGGPMRDRRAARGGDRNEMRDLLDEALEEETDELGDGTHQETKGG